MSRICALLALCGLLGLMACAGESPNPGPAPGPSSSDGWSGVTSDGWVPPSNPSNPSNPNPPTADSGVPSGSGNLSCTEIYSCFYSCSENDTTCAGNCVTQGTSAAQSQYQAVDQCESNAGCTACQGTELTMACATCLDAACSQPYAACGFVYSTCAQVTACFDQCVDTDDACFDTCYSKLTMVGLAQLIAADTCWDTAVAGTCASSCTDQQSDTCYNCTDAQCATEFQTCGWI